MKSLAFGPDAVAALNAANADQPAPCLSPADLGFEVSAIAHLRDHGPCGFATLTAMQKSALHALLTRHATGVSERGPSPRRRTQISSWNALLAYARGRFANLPREMFCVVFLDKRNQHITDEVMNEGTVDHAPVYPREIMRRALELNASAIILLHNHPSGDPTPSQADIDMTRQVVEAGRPLRIAVHDHLVVGRDGTASFKALGIF